MGRAVLVLSMLFIGILLFGCTGGNKQNYSNYQNQTYANYTENHSSSNTGNVNISSFEFSVPSELPTAYVGMPYFYSFCNLQPVEELDSFDSNCGLNVTAVNPQGGTPPYEIVAEEAPGSYIVQVGSVHPSLDGSSLGSKGCPSTPA